MAKPVRGLSGFLALAVGAVPCTGALLILIFGLANDLLIPAIVMVIAISVGMAIALSVVGIAAILGRRFVDRRSGEDAERQHRIATGLRVASALAVLCIGSALFAVTYFDRDGIPLSPETGGNTPSKSPE